MSASRNWAGRRRRVLGALGLAGVMAASVLAGAPVAAAPEQELRSVDVQLGTDGSVQTVTTTSTSVDGQGTVTATSADVSDPDSLADLPIRVQTNWWAGGQAGDDLSQVAGTPGLVRLQVDLQNLTPAPTDVAFEMNGVRYRKVELVGVPLTVVATANLGEIPLEAVVQTADDPDDPVTDGIVSLNSSGEVQVQWARILAPPMLPAATSLQLVVDTEGFVPPSIDFAIQPGIVTDPSSTRLMASAFGADGNLAGLEGSTLGVVMDVRSQLEEANGFLDSVHNALQGDVSQLTSRIVSDLQASSQSVLGQLDGTNDRLQSLQGSFSSSLTSMESQTGSSMTDLANQLAGLLGSTSATPQMTATAIEGCTVQLPQLAPGQPLTVASAVKVLDAQLAAIQSTFDAEADAGASTCRVGLVDAMTSAIGNPAELAGAEASAVCLATPAESRSISCAMHVASLEMSGVLGSLSSAALDSTTIYQEIGIDSLMAPLRGDGGLAASLTSLRTLATSATTDMGSVVEDFQVWVEETTTLVDQAKSAVADAQEDVATVETSITDVRTAYDALDSLYRGGERNVAQSIRTITSATANAAPVGEWFADSGLTDVINGMIGATACDPTWADTLTENSTLDEVTTALGVLSHPSCQLADLADSAIVMAESHEEMATNAATANTEAVSVGLIVDEVDAALDELDTKLTALEEVGTTDLVSLLEGLYTPEVWEDSPIDGEPPVLATPASGTLVDLQTKVDEISASMDTDGSIDHIQSAIAEFETQMVAIWPDDSVAPLNSAAECGSPATIATPAGQAVIGQANRLLCLEGALGASLERLDQEIDSQTLSSAASFTALSGQAQSAYDQVGSGVASASDSLVEALSAARPAANQALTGLINSARTDTESRLQAALAAFGVSTAEDFESLAAAMAAAGAESELVAASLAAEFTTLATNLGSADPTSQVGMLGKLNTITAQVGATGDDLSGIDQNVADFAASRRGSLRDLGLASAQYDRSLELLGNYQPFGAQGSDAVVIFLYHIPGGN